MSVNEINGASWVIQVDGRRARVLATSIYGMDFTVINGVRGYQRVFNLPVKGVLTFEASSRSRRSILLRISEAQASSEASFSMSNPCLGDGVSGYRSVWQNWPERSAYLNLGSLSSSM